MLDHSLEEDVGVGEVVWHAVVPQRRVPLLDQQAPLLSIHFIHFSVLMFTMPSDVIIRSVIHKIN